MSIITSPYALKRNVLAKSVQKLLKPIFAMLPQVKKALQLPKCPPGPLRSHKVAMKQQDKMKRHHQHLATAHPQVEELHDEDLSLNDEPIEQSEEYYSSNEDDINSEPCKCISID